MKRTSPQNSAQWPILNAFAAQLKWPVNGEMVYMTPDDWKAVLTAAFRRDQSCLLWANQIAQRLRLVFCMTSLEYCIATAVMRGIPLTEYERMEQES